MLRIAAPVILAELGWMGMGVVDTLMVGPLGPVAIGAVGVGNSLHFALAVFGMGLFLGLDTLVSQAYGAGRYGDTRRWLNRGAALAALLSPLFIVLGLLVRAAIPKLGFHPDVTPLMLVVLLRADLEHAVSAVLCGVPPLLAGRAHRHAGDVRAAQRQCGQRDVQLDLDSRARGISRRSVSSARHGRRWSRAFTWWGCCWLR